MNLLMTAVLLLVFSEDRTQVLDKKPDAPMFSFEVLANDPATRNWIRFRIDQMQRDLSLWRNIELEGKPIDSAMLKHFAGYTPFGLLDLLDRISGNLSLHRGKVQSMLGNQLSPRGTSERSQQLSKLSAIIQKALEKALLQSVNSERTRLQAELAKASKSKLELEKLVLQLREERKKLEAQAPSITDSLQATSEFYQMLSKQSLEYETELAGLKAEERTIVLEQEKMQAVAQKLVAEDELTGLLLEQVKNCEGTIERVEKLRKTGTIPSTAVDEAKEKLLAAKIEFQRHKIAVAERLGGPATSSISKTIFDNRVKQAGLREKVVVVKQRLKELFDAADRRSKLQENLQQLDKALIDLNNFDRIVQERSKSLKPIENYVPRVVAIPAESAK